MSDIEKMGRKANEILRSLLGSDVLIERWWLSPNKAFDMQLPDEMWHTTSGRNKVYSYLLDQMETPH